MPREVISPTRLPERAEDATATCSTAPRPLGLYNHIHCATTTGSLITTSAAVRQHQEKEKGNKAFQSLLDRVLEYHVTWPTVTPKPVIQRSKSKPNTWDATDDEIDQGRKYIIDHCPVDEAESDLTTWAWKKV